MWIHTHKIDDEHLDSYWYDGDIAETDNFRLYAGGDVELWEGYETPKNDEDLEELYEDDAFKFLRWFYIENKETGEAEAVSGDYDDVLECLVELQEGYKKNVDTPTQDR
jgi:hypothetical protein